MIRDEMYTFVADKLDAVYLSAIPDNHEFQNCDVPEEEFEIREIIDVWYEDAFLPDFNLQRIEIDNKEKLIKTQSHVLRTDTATLAFLLKSRVYQAALKRVLSVWSREQAAKTQLQLVLLSVEKMKKPANI